MKLDLTRPWSRSLLFIACLSHEESVDHKRGFGEHNEGATRSLSTDVLTGSGNTTKKKVYPTNFVEPEESESLKDLGIGQAFVMNQEDDEELESTVQTFERDLEDLKIKRCPTSTRPWSRIKPSKTKSNLI